jgi:hypothetical protein
MTIELNSEETYVDTIVFSNTLQSPIKLVPAHKFVEGEPILAFYDNDLQKGNLTAASNGKFIANLERSGQVQLQDVDIISVRNCVLVN